MTFGQRIQSYRKSKSLSQEGLAEMLYVTRQSVSQWENDKTMPSVDLLVKLSTIFGVSVDTLLGKEEAQPAPKSVGGSKVIRDKKRLRKAVGNILLSTTTVLTSLAVCFAILLIANLSVYPAAFEGIKYYFNFTSFITFAPIAVTAAALAISRQILIRFYIASTYKSSAPTKIEFFDSFLTLDNSEGSTISFNYTELKKVFETDNYFIITMENKKFICIDKADFDGDVRELSKLLSGSKKYRRKILARSKRVGISETKRKVFIIASNALFTSSLFSTWYMSINHAALLTNPYIPVAFRWILMIVPFAICSAAIIFGTVALIRRIKALRVIICGAAALSALVFFDLFTLPVYNFNLHRMSPEEFTSVMKSRNMTVEDTGRGRTERMLWDCYTARSEDGSLEIEYYNFIDDSASQGYVYAAELYYNLQNNPKFFANYINQRNRLDLLFNNIYTAKTEDNYCYISLNKYTVINITTSKDNCEKVKEIFSDYLMELPY